MKSSGPTYAAGRGGTSKRQRHDIPPTINGIATKRRLGRRIDERPG
ncbi:hypothetical protein [Burkholderia sp. WAC0059]|nr:hypothetical protein [Burkholderia sp. WAC0059]